MIETRRLKNVVIFSKQFNVLCCQEKLQDLNYEKYDEIVEATKIELERSEISKKSIDKFEKLIIPMKYLHLVLQAKNITEKLQYLCLIVKIIIKIYH